MNEVKKNFQKNLISPIHNQQKQYTLILNSKLIELLFDHTKDRICEVCGVLIGKKINPTIFQITHVIYDDNSINPSTLGVTRNTKNVYPNVKKIVENSEEIIDYIGEWHSHMFGSCTYSSTDKYSMKMLLNDPNYKFPDELILIIIQYPSIIRAFLFKKNEKNPLEMEITINSESICS